MLERAADGMPKSARALLTAIAASCATPTCPRTASGAGTCPKVGRVAAPPAAGVGHPVGTWPLFVDRRAPWFGAWYEFFLGRSIGPATTESGTLRKPPNGSLAIAEMGFDIVYLPPIHLIGAHQPQGPEQHPRAGPHDPGSLWAIGSEEGGHATPSPTSGTLDDFEAFVAAAGRTASGGAGPGPGDRSPVGAERTRGSPPVRTAPSPTPRIRRRNTGTSTRSGSTATRPESSPRRCGTALMDRG